MKKGDVMLKWLAPPSWEDLRSSPEYQKAKRIAEEFTPTEEVSYQWVYQHALDQYKDVTETISDLDRKADGMIRYLAPGSGLVSMAAGFIVFSGKHPELAAIMAIGAVFIIGAMALSALAVLPHQQCLAPSVESALASAVHFKNENHAKGYWATAIQMAIEVKAFVADYKARRIELSYNFFAIALAWLVLATLLALTVNYFL